jgi:hypothetical protein
MGMCVRAYVEIVMMYKYFVTCRDYIIYIIIIIIIIIIIVVVVVVVVVVLIIVIIIITIPGKRGKYSRKNTQRYDLF